MGDGRHRIPEWCKRAGWTQGELRRRILQRAAVDPSYRHVAPSKGRVAQWFKGEHPRHPVPQILADIFSDHFGFEVTPDDLGLGSHRVLVKPTVPLYPETRFLLLRELRDLTGRHLMLTRRDLLEAGGCLLTSAGLLGPLNRWLDDVPPASIVDDVPRMKIGTTQLELIELAAREFREWNWQVGGMFWKSALGHLQYVTEQISEPYSERVKRRLYAVAADLGETVAHMARDLGYHAEAQRYYGLALRAAREAQEWALGAHILASMAGHMIELGHPHEGLELVHLAQKGERGQATPTLRAMLRIRESWAYVKMAEPRDGRRAISQAEDEFSDYQPTDDPHWLRYVSSAEFNGVCGSRYRDLVRYDTRALEHSARSYEVALAMRDPQYVRSRALDYTGLAKVRLLQGEVEQACATADKALAIAEKIQSPTVTQKIHEFLRQVMQYRSLGSVRVFEEKVHVVLGVSV